MVRTPNYDLDVDTSLGGADASDYVIPSQKAIKSYVDNNTGSTVDQIFDGQSANAQSGVAIAGELSTNYVKSSAENTDLQMTSSIGYLNDIFPAMQLNWGTYQFSVSCSEGAALQAADTSTGNSFILSAIPNGLMVLQGSNLQALLSLSSNSNLAINGNEVATVNDIPDTSNLANKDLSNLSVTGEAKFQSPISDLATIRTQSANGQTAYDNMDGAWTFPSSPITICSNLSVNGSGYESFALSSILPNDDNLYEMILSCSGETGSASGNRVQLILSSSNTFTGQMQVFDTIARSASRVFGSGTVMFPAKSTTILKVAKNSTYTGTIAINCLAYRKVR